MTQQSSKPPQVQRRSECVVPKRDTEWWREQP